jgi:streptomycin 3"-adenylyltransferase
MRPTSDVDVLAVVDRPTTPDDRAALIHRVMPISGAPAASSRWRPVELTVVTRADVVPWRYPPVMQFMYGEWLKTDYRRGFVPEPEPNPDLAILLTIARGMGTALVGPPPADVLAPVPVADVRRAMVHGLDGLTAEIETDTRNVLLTIARIWQTLATGEIHSKDAAANWAAARLPREAGIPVARAALQYVGGVHGNWARSIPTAQAAAEAMIAEIRTSGA